MRLLVAAECATSVRRQDMMTNCVYCNNLENGDSSSTWGWFAVNEDGYKVCPDCEERFGLGETIADEMYSARQSRSEAGRLLGKKSWEARKDKADMSALGKKSAAKRWGNKNVK